MNRKNAPENNRAEFIARIAGRPQNAQKSSTGVSPV